MTVFGGAHQWDWVTSARRIKGVRYECHEVKRSVYQRPCLFEAENAVWVGVLCLIFMPFVSGTFFAGNRTKHTR